MSRPQQKSIRILVGHRQALVRAALTALILDSSDFKVVAEAQTAEELEKALSSVEADVALVSLTLLDPPPYRKLNALLYSFPGVRFVALCQNESIEQQAAAIGAGARGLVGQGTPGRSLCEALRSVGHGLRWMETTLERYLDRCEPTAHSLTFDALTPRERQVAALIARGETYQRIASELRISSHTVKNHVRHIFDKLDVNSRVELAVLTVGETDPTG